MLPAQGCGQVGRREARHCSGPSASSPKVFPSLSLRLFACVLGTLTVAAPQWGLRTWNRLIYAAQWVEARL